MKKEIIEELYEHFYNQNSLRLVIEERLEEFEWMEIPKNTKEEIKKVLDLVWVVDSISKQIDNLMNELLENE